MRLPPPKPTGPRRPAPPPGMMYGPNDMLIPIPTRGGVKPKNPVKPRAPVKPPKSAVEIPRPKMMSTQQPDQMKLDTMSAAKAQRGPVGMSNDANALAQQLAMQKQGMSKGGAAKKGMAYGGMAKKGMAKGGMANCGASMKPAQKGKK